MWWEWLVVGLLVSVAGAYLARAGAGAVRQLGGGVGGCGGGCASGDAARTAGRAVELVQLTIEPQATQPHLEVEAPAAGPTGRRVDTKKGSG